MQILANIKGFLVEGHASLTMIHPIVDVANELVRADPSVTQAPLLGKSIAERASPDRQLV